jgi:sensor c-di-GMP phosphodiesterase-like protein
VLSDKRNKISYIAAIVLLSVMPIAAFIGIEYVQTVSAAKVSLERVASAAIHRTNRMLEDAELMLGRLAHDSDLSPTPETIRLLARAEYIDARFREIGLIDAQGHLVATNRGPVSPPLAIDSASRANLSQPRVQVLGLFRTHVMGERSIVLSLPVAGGGEVNALVDPSVLLGFLGEAEADPEGFAAFMDASGNVLAKLGRAPVHDNVLSIADETDSIRAMRTSNHGAITVVVEATKDWVLRGWWQRLSVAVPIAVLCNALLVMLILRNFRPVGLDRDLRSGLQRDEFSVHYQPIVELETGRWLGAESLLRWHHPRHDVLRPSVFIPIAEDTGTLPELTDWLLRRVAVETRAVRDGHPDFLLAVNVAPSQLEKGVAAPLVKSLADSGLDPGSLIFEVTEASLWDLPDDGVRSAMAALHSQGPAFALDDFGCGCFSFENVVEMNFKYLKIDKSIVRAIGRDQRRIFVLDGLIDLARKLRLEVVAEGVEREEQRDYLLARGVRWGQGWLFSPAVPIADLERRLKKAGRANR